MRVRTVLFVGFSYLVATTSGCGSVASRSDGGGAGSGGAGAGGGDGGAGTGGAGAGGAGAGGVGGGAGSGAGGASVGGAGGGSGGGVGTTDAGVDGGPPSCPALPSGAVAWWHANGDYADAVGSNTGASAGGVTFGAGQVGQAFVLNGAANSYVQVADAASLRVTSAITIDAWIQSTVGATGRIVDKITAGNADGYLLDLLSGGLRFDIGGAGVTSAVPLPANQFTHVAGVYSGSALSLYVNGVFAATASSGAVAAIPVNNLPLRIGADSQGVNRFTGAIDEPRIFSRALSASEIQTIYQEGSAAHCGCVSAPSGAVGWWPGENNLTDVAGGHNGTDAGAVAFAPGAVGSGFNLSGAATSYVQVADTASLRITGALTMEAWIDANALGGRIIDKITAGGIDGYLLDTVGGQLRIDISGHALSSGAANPLPTATFVHVAGVYDGTNLTLYINGAAVASALAGIAAISTSTLPLRIGADSQGASLFNGIIDEPRIYNRALSTSEILAIYRQGAAARCH